MYIIAFFLGVSLTILELLKGRQKETAHPELQKYYSPERKRRLALG